MKAQLPNILGEADAQAVFHIAWLLKGYKGPAAFAPTSAQMLATTIQHFTRQSYRSKRAQAYRWYYCYGDAAPIPLPDWWTTQGTFKIPEGWNSLADDPWIA